MKLLQIKVKVDPEFVEERKECSSNIKMCVFLRMKLYSWSANC
jgi:hypothetical protein